MKDNELHKIYFLQIISRGKFKFISRGVRGGAKAQRNTEYISRGVRGGAKAQRNTVLESHESSVLSLESRVRSFENT
jgi:hypothetical protein